MGRTITPEIIRLAKVDSTNRYAADLLRNGDVEEGTVIVADKQYAGKGLDKNQWESEPGMNLTLSLVLHPDFLRPEAQFMLTKTISLGVLDFLQELMPGKKDISIKWPNDIYIGNGKVCGMLISNAIKSEVILWSIVGIGVNINQMKFISDAPNPVSVAKVTGRSYDLGQCLDMLLRSVLERYSQLSSSGNQRIDMDYLRFLYRLGTIGDYIYRGQKIRAASKGVDANGRLEMKTINGEDLVCDLKEVSFVL